MTIGTVKRLAADIFNVGENKIRINPDSLKDAEGALTRADVKSLIEKGIITKKKPQGRASTGKTGRRGHGRRRGTPVDLKTVWMDKVRSQRKMLVLLVSSGAVKKDAKRELYYKIKSGIFRNKRAMLLYLKDNKLVPADYELPKTPYKKPEPNVKKASNANKVSVVKTEVKKEEHKKPVEMKSEPAKHEAKPEHTAHAKENTQHEKHEHTGNKKGENK